MKWTFRASSRGQTRQLEAGARWDPPGSGLIPRLVAAGPLRLLGTHRTATGSQVRRPLSPPSEAALRGFPSGPPLLDPEVWVPPTPTLPWPLLHPPSASRAGGSHTPLSPAPHTDGRPRPGPSDPGFPPPAAPPPPPAGISCNWLRPFPPSPPPAPSATWGLPLPATLLPPSESCVLQPDDRPSLPHSGQSWPC